MKRLVLEIDDEEHKKIKTKAVMLGKSMREIMLELLRKWLGQKG